MSTVVVILFLLYRVYRLEMRVGRLDSNERADQNDRLIEFHIKKYTEIENKKGDYEKYLQEKRDASRIAKAMIRGTK